MKQTGNLLNDKCKRIVVFFFICVSCSMVKESTVPEIKGNDRIIELRVQGRKLSIYLPPHYEKTDSEFYRVIYFNDGHWIFGPGWDLQDSLDRWISSNLIQPLIVVGIHNDIDRTNDLVPYFDPWIAKNWGPYLPKADEYSNFIKTTIIPFVTKEFRTKPEHKNQAFFGASLGGLHCLWDAMKHPDQWGFVGALSPSFWVNDFEIFKEVQSGNSTIWFDIGATTGEWNYYLPIIDSLIDKGYSYGHTAFYLEDPKGRHLAVDWVKRLRYPLILFAGKDASRDIKDWQIEIEIIQSAQTPGKYFLRINPIIELENGVKYSAANQATYTLLNNGAGQLGSDGSFKFNGQQDLQVRISYQQLKEDLVIGYQWVQAQK